MRRHRRLDVGRGSNCYHLDSFFRDSYMGDDGVETVIHEYTVTAEVDASTLTITNAVATPRVLPWLDCPAAAASAGGLAGRMIGELRSGVRRDLVGAATCTHLNDQLRSLDDLLALARLLA
jgi:hypothetical protein